MLRTDFNKKLGVELYKKAAYLDNKPKTRQALIKVARAIYNGRDASFAIRTYFQPKQRKQAADVVNCVAHRLKQAERTCNKEASLSELASKGLRYGKNSIGRGVDRAGSLFLMGEARANAARRMATRDMFKKINDAASKGQKSPGWLSTRWGKGALGTAGLGGTYMVGSHAGRAGAADALEAHDKQIAEELNKQISQYNNQMHGLTAQGAGGASGTILDHLQGAGNSALDWVKNNPGKSIGIGTAAVGLPLLLSYLNRRRRRDDD